MKEKIIDSIVLVIEYLLGIHSIFTLERIEVLSFSSLIVLILYLLVMIVWVRLLYSETKKYLNKYFR